MACFGHLPRRDTVGDIARINLQHIIHAALNDDMLATEIISEAGKKIGCGIAAIMNLFNPELIILGGSLAETDAYIRLPINAAINKYSLSLVSTDTELRMSSLGRKAGVMGHVSWQEIKYCPYYSKPAAFGKI